MDRAEAIKRFEKQLTSAMVVLDSGFGTNPGESNRLYLERKEMAEIALAALREQEQSRGRASVDQRGGEVPVTNAEWLRSLDDEGLANAMPDIAYYGDGLTAEQWLEWLQQPHEECFRETTKTSEEVHT